jgi:hypothetical protein
VQSACLVGVLAVIVLGGPLVDTALRAPAGPPLDLAPGVRLPPLSGWRLARAQFEERPALLTRGSANLEVLSLPGDAGPDELARGYLSDYLEPAAIDVVIEPAEPVLLASGLGGARIAYRGEFDGPDRGGTLAGEITALVSPSGTGVIFDAFALDSVYDYERDDVRTMIERARVA